MHADGQPRLAAELLATADALRHLVAQICGQVEAGNPAVINLPSTAVLLVDGLAVADALDDLAGRLGITR